MSVKAIVEEKKKAAEVTMRTQVSFFTLLNMEPLYHPDPNTQIK